MLREFIYMFKCCRKRKNDEDINSSDSDSENKKIKSVENRKNSKSNKSEIIDKIDIEENMEKENLLFQEK